MSPTSGSARRPRARTRWHVSSVERVFPWTATSAPASARAVAIAAPEAARGAGHERDPALEGEEAAHFVAFPGSSPDPPAAYSGWTLTTPNCRSIPSRCAAIIQRKLIDPPGAATPGW